MMNEAQDMRRCTPMISRGVRREQSVCRPSTPVLITFSLNGSKIRFLWFAPSPAAAEAEIQTTYYSPRRPCCIEQCNRVNPKVVRMLPGSIVYLLYHSGNVIGIMTRIYILVA